MSARLIEPTEPARERSLGRIALWLDPADLQWLGSCGCPSDLSVEQREQHARVKCQALAALQTATVGASPSQNETSRAEIVKKVEAEERVQPQLGRWFV